MSTGSDDPELLDSLVKLSNNKAKEVIIKRSLIVIIVDFLLFQDIIYYGDKKRYFG